MKIVIKGHFIEHISFFKFQCYFDLLWELSDNTCISWADPVLTGAVFPLFIKKNMWFLVTLSRVVYISWIGGAALRRSSRFALRSCVETWWRCEMLYSIRPSWRLAVKVKAGSVSPVLLENWPVGHSVCCCPGGRENFTFSLPPISLSLWLCFFLL